jgi:uncharacterized protein (DUF2235 family)
VPNPSIPATFAILLILTYQIGTWLDSDNGLANGQQVPPSNVSRIAWATKNTSRDGIPQVVYYQAGVGSMGSQISRFLGGAIGAGLKENVREAYSYLSINYRPGDEIFLLGFSRGAYTARAVGGMIGDLGLLTKEGLMYFPEIYEDYQHRNDTRYVSKFRDIPFPDKPPFDDPKYLEELERRGLTVTRIPIKAIGVWDTVGSLGVPRVPFLENLGLQSRRMKDLRFYDTQLYDGIENAFQALALDEPRAPFMPTLWEKGSRNTRTNLKQVWFPGVHSNIGGGYDDQEMANITLAWMMSRLEPFIDFRPEYIQSVYESNRQYYKRTKQKPRWWSFGEIYNSVTGVYALAGTKVRTPGNYYRVDPATGRPTKKLLKNTNEYIHASARSRTGLNGPGVQDRGVYESRALREWQFSTEEPTADAQEPMVVWTDHSDRNEGQKVIPEAILLPTERALLENSPRVEDYVLDMKAPTKRRSKRRSKPPE